MSKHHQGARWANHARAARQRIAAMLPYPCVECGRVVLPEQAWDVGHIVALSQGGDARTYGPAHRSCNRKAGGRLGAATRNRPTSSKPRRGVAGREASW